MFGWVYWYSFLIGYVPLIKLPLKLLESIIGLFQLLALELPQYLIFGIRFGQKFSDASMPLLFLRLAIISTILFAILFLASGIRMHFQKQGEENALSIAMKNAVAGTFWLLAIPIILFIAMNIFNIILSLLVGNNVSSISKTIFMSLKNPENTQISINEWEKMANNNFTFEQQIFNKMKDGEAIMLIILGGITTISTLIPFLLGALTLVQKIYQQFFLFIISPFIIASSVGDNGKRIKIFVESYAAKSFAILAMIAGLQLFAAYLGRAGNWVNSSVQIPWYSKLLLIFAIVAGGAVATNGIANEVTAFIGESTSVRETMGETKNLMKTGMALAGGVGAVAAVGKRMGNFATSAKGRSRNRRNDTIKHAKQKLREGTISRSQYKDIVADARREHLENKMTLTEAKQERKMMKQQFQANEIIANAPEGTFSDEQVAQAKAQNLGKNASDYSNFAPILAGKQSISGFVVSRLTKKQEKGKQLSDNQQKRLNKHRARFTHLENVLDNKTKGLPTFSTTALNRYGGNKRVKEATGTRKQNPKYNNPATGKKIKKNNSNSK